MDIDCKVYTGRCVPFLIFVSPALSTVFGIQSGSLEKMIDKLHFRPQCLWASSLTGQGKITEKELQKTGPKPEGAVWDPPYASHSLFNQPAKWPRFPHRGNSESIRGC